MENSESKVLLVEDNLVNAKLVEKMLKDVDSHAFQVTHADSLVKALDLLAHDRFDAALVDLSLPDSDGLETFLAIQRHAPHLAIVVLTGWDSDATAARAVELGAQDYLAKGTLSTSELTRALHHAIIRSRKLLDAEKPEQRSADVVGFLGCKGGVGTTTLACHAARELKKQTGEDILLMGLDVHSAGVAFLMKVQSEYTLADAALNLHRLDSNFWRHLVSSTPDQIDVLPPPGCTRLAQDLNGERVHHVVRFARPLYGRVVVDLGVLDSVSVRLVEEVTVLYVVTTEDLAALWETGRLLKRLIELGLPQDRVHLIVNRRRRKGTVPIGDLEKALGYGIHATVNDSPDLADAQAEGCLVGTKSQVYEETANIVSRLLGKDEAVRSRSALGLFRLCRV